MKNPGADLRNQFPFDDKPEKSALSINEDLFCELPDGTALRWGFGKRRASIKHLPNKQDDNRLRDAINRASKKLARATTEEATKQAKASFPRFFSMPENSQYKLLIADFDRLPRKIKSFTELYRQLCECFPNEVVARSVTGKVKIFFLIQHYYGNLQDYESPVKLRTSTIHRAGNQPCYGPQPLPPEVTHERALEMLSALFYRHDYTLTKLTPESLIKALDDNWSALRTSSISESICNEIKRIKNSPVHSMDINFQLNQPAQTAKKQRVKQLRYFKGEIPAFFVPLLKKGKIRNAHERFIRVLLASKQLAYPEGFDMPLTKVATACRKKPAQIAIWRRELERAGFIKCIDERYERGIKAKTYIALGELQIFLLGINGNVNIAPWPKTFEDGEWAKEGFRAICIIVSQLKSKQDEEIRSRVIAWIEGLEGLASKFDRRPRLYKALKKVIADDSYLPTYRRLKQRRG